MDKEVMRPHNYWAIENLFHIAKDFQHYTGQKLYWCFDMHITVIIVAEVLSKKVELSHLLGSMYFLKLYSTEERCAAVMSEMHDVDPSTQNKHISPELYALSIHEVAMVSSCIILFAPQFSPSIPFPGLLLRKGM